jgi:hypothetical protein
MTTLKEISDNKLVLSFSSLKKDDELVREIQGILNKFGLYKFQPDDPDGAWGPRTETGLEKFCDSVHLNSFDTGIFGPTFAEALLDTTAINPIAPNRFALPTWWHGGNKNELAAAVKAEGKNQGVTNRNQWCYIMATIQHETAHTYKPIAEFGGKNRSYAPYYGRGYVQLTHKFNYAKYSALIAGRDFVKHPDEVMEPDVSLFIIIHGMKHGNFTGKKLDDFISGASVDFFHARRIINGMDRADLIRGYAINWQGTTAF